MSKIFGKIIFWILKLSAKIQLKKINPVIVGIGGSSGKTSLANIVGIMLSQKHTVRNSSGKNSHTGIPLTILGIDPGNYGFFDWLRVLIECKIKLLTSWKKFDFYIAEMGIDGPKEPNNMSYLLKIVTPTVGVLTNISYEHSVYFENYARGSEKKILELTAKEENFLLSSIPQKGYAVVNIDDPLIKNNINKIKANIISVSKEDKTSNIFIKKIDSDLEAFSVLLSIDGKEYRINLKNPLPEHFAYSFALALGVAKSVGIEIEEAILGLEKNFSLPSGRMSIFKGIKQTSIIDSSYNNATLQPILDLLDFLKEKSGSRRKVAIIGDMRELGILSEEMHQTVARKLLETVDFAILIGPMMKKFAEPILKKNKFNFVTFENFSFAKQYILDNIKKEDMVLVKSSQNTLFLERVVEMLLEDKKDVEKLCRRGDFWDIQRSKSS